MASKYVDFQNALAIAIAAGAGGDSKMNYYVQACYAPSTRGDASFSGIIPFNKVIFQVGDCFNTDTGIFTCPVDGYYNVCFTYFSNNSAVAQRSAIYVNDSMKIQINGPYGRSLNTVIHCSAGDTIGAGGVSSSLPVNIYTAEIHNEFTVMLIQAD